MKDITHSFAAIEDELRSQYVVSYKPANFDADGRYRSIEISSLKKDTSGAGAQGILRAAAVAGTASGLIPVCPARFFLSSLKRYYCRMQNVGSGRVCEAPSSVLPSH